MVGTLKFFELFAHLVASFHTGVEHRANHFFLISDKGFDNRERFLTVELACFVHIQELTGAKARQKQGTVVTGKVGKPPQIIGKQLFGFFALVHLYSFTVR